MATGTVRRKEKTQLFLHLAVFLEMIGDYIDPSSDCSLLLKAQEKLLVDFELLLLIFSTSYIKVEVGSLFLVLLGKNSTKKFHNSVSAHCNSGGLIEH